MPSVLHEQWLGLNLEVQSLRDRDEYHSLPTHKPAPRTANSLAAVLNRDAELLTTVMTAQMDVHSGRSPYTREVYVYLHLIL